MTDTILQQLLAIRDSGETNMFDLHMVEKLAFDRGYYDLVNYIEDDHGRYARFILYGREEELTDTE